MKNMVIYGCGDVGKLAYEYFKCRYDILFFVDKSKYGEEWKGIKIYEPNELKRYPDVKIVIACMEYYRDDILNDIRRLGIQNSDIEFFSIEKGNVLPEKIKKELDKRTIELGDFLQKYNAQISCKELTFIGGGSGVLDYAFLSTVAKVSNAKEYLEIGTYIGESINVLAENCDKLYSVTAPVGSPMSGREWFKLHEMPDYSERLTYNKKIVHYFCDSKQFDFSKHADTVDLYFIDGDHSYNGVYWDTKNVFQNKKEDAVVVWHDFRKSASQYNVDVVKAVSDVLNEEFENVYVTNNNI